MRTLLVCVIAAATLALPVAAAIPTYTPQFLGAANHIDAMNESGAVVGWVSAGATRAFVAGPSRPYLLLPLPPGMQSSYAKDINEAGAIVGAVGPSSSPEYYLGGRAASWTPDGSGSYTVTLLGQLPGHIASQATALNDVGDIVGFSFTGMFRLPVLFTPSGPVDLSATGIFDPVGVNDHRVVVDQSATARRLDLNTMHVENLGVPPGSYSFTRAEAINESGMVVGAAILATSTDCDHQAARYGSGGGWEILSGCGRNNSAYDVNALGDVIMQLNLAVWVNLAGFGAHTVQDLISTAKCSWLVMNAYGNALNDARQIAVLATNPTTGQSGAVLLTPDGATAAPEVGAPVTAARLSLQPNPFRSQTTVRFELARSGRAVLTVHDVAGRRIALLADRMFPAGAAAVAWDGRDSTNREMPAGVYFARLATDGGATTQKVTKLR